MTAIEILRNASRSVPNEDYVQFMAAVDAVEELIDAGDQAAHERLGEGPVARWRNMERFRAAIAKTKGEQP